MKNDYLSEELYLINEFPMKFSTLLGISTFMPFYFNRQLISLEASCHTHLISIWNLTDIKRQPSSLLHKLIDTLVISYNRLRGKVIEMNLKIPSERMIESKLS